MCTLAAERIAVGIFDGAFHVVVSNDGVGKGNPVSETATPGHKWTEKHCKWKEKRDFKQSINDVPPCEYQTCRK